MKEATGLEPEEKDELTTLEEKSGNNQTGSEEKSKNSEKPSRFDWLLGMNGALLRHMDENPYLDDHVTHTPSFGCRIRANVDRFISWLIMGPDREPKIDRRKIGGKIQGNPVAVKRLSFWKRGK